MSSRPEVPIKGKKKKRSFLDDDDFFVKKKPRPKTPASPRLSVPPPAPSMFSGDADQDTTVRDHAETSTNQNRPPASADSYNSEEASASFHSANESFQDPDLMASPVALMSTECFSQKSHILHLPEGQALLSNECSTEQSTAGLARENSAASKQEIDGRMPEYSVYAGSELNLATDAALELQQDGAGTDLLDPDLQEFFSVLAKKKALHAEHGRLYRLKVTSRLGIPLEYEKEISGETTFGQLLDILLGDTLREFNDPNYWKHGVLVWVEGRLELKPFFKPSTLRLPQAPGHVPTQISCLYIPPEHVHNFENLYAEFDASPVEKSVICDQGPEREVVVLLDLSDEEPTCKISEKSQYFVIGLKGRDNKRVEAEVGPTTQIRSLLTYYMQVKGIKETPGRPGRLLFDDEELDLSATVGDTELEEDFEVQVHI